MSLRLTTVAAFVAVILTVAPAAFAQESGSFRSLHSYQHTYITVTMATGRLPAAC